MKTEVSVKELQEQERPASALCAWHYCALALPFVGLLYPPLYARLTPVIFGLPFFYAYQFIWIGVSVGLTALVYWSIRK